MASTRIRASLAATAFLLAAALNSARADGPDLIVGDLHGVTGWTVVQPYEENGVLYRAFSIGTNACNVGTEILDWVAASNQHPVIAQNMYKLEDGRLRQIGMSWLKHGFCALQNSLCGTCQPTGPDCEQSLGIGCSDPYAAFTNGNQGNLGPRWQVNPVTGDFAYPFDTQGQTGNPLYKRIRIVQDEIDPNLNPAALYFIEGQYVHPDDASAGNGANNASYRRVSINTSLALVLEGQTERTKPAIFAWADHGLGLGLPDPDVSVVPVDVPGDGRFWLACKVSDNGDGTYHYEYAVQNLTSDRAGGSFTVPTGSATISAAGFHDIDYHSGEPFDPTDWTLTVGTDEVRWASPADFATNPDSNALRWATLYNFWFDADAPPVAGQVELGLFKPGTPAAVSIAALVPDPGGCAGDLDGDGHTGFSDLVVLLSGYGSSDAGDLDGDNDTDFDDLVLLLADYGC